MTVILRFLVPSLGLLATATAFAAAPASYREPPYLAERVAKGELPPVNARVPKAPSVVMMDGANRTVGRYGGSLDMLMGRAKDIRMMVVYGYARLVGYDRELNLGPDILERVDVTDGRIFTLHLRPGHRWSDGHPFTAEDFRYYWEDVANNEELSPAGVPQVLRVAREAPTFEVIDATTVRYGWSRPNPFFLPALAGARPLYIYRPAHYLKQFHAKHEEQTKLERRVKEEGQRNWVALQFRKGRQYRNNNPDLPTLQPWVLTTKPPSDRFVFVRNPYYHRVDPEGRQLPYIDEAVFTIASAKLIPAKAGAGESDLQARSINFSDYAFLKQGEKRSDYSVRLWHSAKGSHVALYPNLNTADAAWRDLLRDVRVRRALSLAINRQEINDSIFFGLGLESNNTVLPQSRLHKDTYGTRWVTFDPKQANRLLDAVGLAKRTDQGLRLLPDGRPFEIVVETAGEDPQQVDVLQLIHDSWLKIGVKAFIKPLQREVFRNRIFAGTTIMSVWSGLENGFPRRRHRRRSWHPPASNNTSGRNGASTTKPAARPASRSIWRPPSGSATSISNGHSARTPGAARRSGRRCWRSMRTRCSASD